MTEDKAAFLLARGQLDADAAKHIEEWGISVMAVFPTEEGDGMGFAYSIGLAEVGSPELIVFGLVPEVAQYVINETYSRWIKGTVNLEHGELVEGMLGANSANSEIDLLLIGTDKEKSGEYLTGSARRFALDYVMKNLDAILLESTEFEWPEEVQSDDGLDFAPVDALQIVVPDTEGVWPWDDCHPLAKKQPNLSPDSDGWSKDPR